MKKIWLLLLLSLLSSNDISNKSILKLQSSKVLSNFQGKTHEQFNYTNGKTHEQFNYTNGKTREQFNYTNDEKLVQSNYTNDEKLAQSNYTHTWPIPTYPPTNDDYVIVPYRIVPGDSPTIGCWSRIEMIGEYTGIVREKLYHEIIMIELYYEVPEYIVIKNKTYYLLKLPVNSYD